jgi:hypothetical protein
VRVERRAVELRRVHVEEALDHRLRDAPERVVRMRVPDVEQVVPAAPQDTMHFAEGLRLVGIEHDAELADDEVGALVVEGQGLRIGRLERDGFARRELPLRDLEHRRVEIGRGEPRARGQGIAKAARDDAGARRRLDQDARIERRGARRDVERVGLEQDRSEPAIIVFRNAADERCVTGTAHVILRAAMVTMPSR